MSGGGGGADGRALATAAGQRVAVGLLANYAMVLPVSVLDELRQGLGVDDELVIVLPDTVTTDEHLMGYLELLTKEIRQREHDNLEIQGRYIAAIEAWKRDAWSDATVKEKHRPVCEVPCAITPWVIRLVAFLHTYCMGLTTELALPEALQSARAPPVRHGMMGGP